MIIIPITAKNIDDALFMIDGASKAADAIELRLDYFVGPTQKEIARLVKACAKPCICTCRSKGEGGKFSGTESERIRILLKAIKAGCHYVDVEFETKPVLRKKVYTFAKKHHAKVILSRHCTTHTPPLAELSELLEKMRKDKAHVVKIVAKATRHSDNKVILGLFRDANRKRVKLIAFCMGDIGMDSRILSRFLGAFATFASLSAGHKSAEGQITVHEMKKHHRQLAEALK